MTWSLAAVREGIAKNLTWLDNDLRVYQVTPGQLQPPCAVIVTGEPLVDRDQAMQRGLAIVNLQVVVLVPLSNIEAAFRLLDLLVVKVPDSLLSDRTLEGVADDLTVGQVDGYSEAEVGGVPSLRTAFEVTVYVNEES